MSVPQMHDVETVQIHEWRRTQRRTIILFELLSGAKNEVLLTAHFWFEDTA
jgi:hypothetical protein